MEEYVSLKLITGQELIGLVDSSCEESISIVNPVEIVHDFDESGYSLVKFVSFMTWVENELFTFNHKHVIMSCNPTKKLIDYYNQYVKSLKESENADVFSGYDFPSTSKH